MGFPRQNRKFSRTSFAVWIPCVMVAICAPARAKTDPAAAVLSGPLSQKSIHALWDDSAAQIPNLSQLKYGVKAKSYCSSDWKLLLGAKVTKKPVTTSLADFETAARKAGLSSVKLHKVLATFLENQERIPNQDHVSIVDFDKRSDEDRLFVIDLRSARIRKFKTSGGKGSDPSSSGFSTLFSNQWDPSEHTHTYASSLGCYLSESRNITTREVHKGSRVVEVLHDYRTGKGGRPTMILHGFESTNDNACNREVFLHVDESRPSYVGHLPGRSWGCFAVRPEDSVPVFTELSGGALICAYREGKYAEAAVQPAASARKGGHHSVSKGKSNG